MKIVGLEGHEIATYDQARVDGKPKSDSLGSAFACYTANPQPFTLLTTADGDRIEIRAAEGASFLATPEDASSKLSLSGIMHSLESSVAGESPAPTPSHVSAWPEFVTKVTRPNIVIVPHLFQALRHLPCI